MVSHSRRREILETIYERLHRPEFIDPDPLSRVLRYPEIEDREIAALVCAAVSLGRVGGILSACDGILSRFGPRFRDELADLSLPELRERFSGFRYRFFGPGEISSFLWALKRVVEDYGSLETCFAEGYRDHHPSVLPALEAFARRVKERTAGGIGILLPDPGKGGACKRLHLYLRWLVRADRIDPGGWRTADPGKLVIPLDTHIHRVAVDLGITRRRTADLRTAREVTESLRRIDPTDPVRFDFSLSRLGIHPLARKVLISLDF